MLQGLRAAAKRLPGAVPAYRFARTHIFGAQTRRSLFARYYREDAWLGGESRSGRGSTLEETANVRTQLPAIVRALGPRTLLDLPCGDFHWMKLVDLGPVSYIGADIVPEIIEHNRQRYGDAARRFMVIDIVRDPLPSADLVLSRDLLVHLCFAEIRAALKNLKRSGATWLLTTTYPQTIRNEDTATGGWRPLNLTRPPFGFPQPCLLIEENCMEEGGRWRDKSLALWRITDLP